MRLYWISCTIIASFAAGSAAWADSVTDNFLLNAIGQNIWGPGQDSYTSSNSVGGSFGPSTGGFGIGSTSGFAATGAAFNFSASGGANVGYSAGVSGGTVNVTAANSTAFSITNNYYRTRSFDASVSGGLTNASTMSFFAPSVQSSVSGGFNLNVTGSATGCFLGACSSSSSTLVNFNTGKVHVIDFNSMNTPPISLFGVPVALAGVNSDINLGGGVTFGFYAPTNLPDAGSLTGTSAIGLNTVSAYAAAGVTQPGIRVGWSPIDAFFPEANPSFSFGPVSGGLTSFDANFGLDVGMSNDLTANVPEILMLQFSQPVSGTYANGLSFGPTDTIDLGIDDPNYASSVTLSWAGKAGDLESRTYAADPSAYLANGVGIGFGADLNISAACYNIGLSIGALSTSKSGCAYTNDFNFPLGAIPVTTVDAPLNFNSYTVDYSPIAGVGAVPELSTWAMLLIGCFGVAYAAGRQRKGHESTSLKEAANTLTRLASSINRPQNDERLQGEAAPAHSRARLSSA